MAVTTISYNNSKDYVGDRRKPFADILLRGTPNLTFKAVVDTGADYLMLPATAAAEAGLNLNLGEVVTVNTVGGQVDMRLLPRVSVEIEGTAITTEVLFHPDDTKRPLLGRNAIRALKNVGFDSSRWLW